MRNLGRWVNSTLVFVAVMLFSACGGDSTQKFLEISVNEANKSFPVQIDKMSRIDRCEAMPDHTLKYIYTIFPNDEVKVDGKKFRKVMTPVIIYGVKHSRDLDELKQRNIKFLYSYKDKLGNQVCEILVTPDDYNAEQQPFQPVNIEEFILNE